MQNIYQYVDDHIDEAVGRLTRLCRQPSVSAQGLGIVEMAHLVAEMMQECGISARILPTSEKGSPVVYGELRGESPRTLLLYGHYDTQPADPFELWSSPPFEPTFAGDILRARGVADDKGNLAARLSAIKAYLDVKGQLPISIKFCLEGEEEIGSPHLEPFVSNNQQLLKADACLWEGHGVDWEGHPKLILGLKGIVGVELETRTAVRDSHSSMATLVPNAAWRLVWALNCLKDADENILIAGFYDQVQAPTAEELEMISALPSEEDDLKQSLGLRALLKNVSGVDYYRRHLLEPVVTINGLLSGYTGEGTKTVLPCFAKAKLDFRLVPNQTPEDIVAKVRKHLDRCGFDDVEVKPSPGTQKPARTSPTSPFVNIVREAAREAYGLEPRIWPSWAASGPMYYFTNILGLPTVSIGVDHPDSRLHAPDENIRVSGLAKNIKHVAAVFERFAREQSV